MLKLNQTVTYNGRPHQLITLPIPGRKTTYVTIRDPANNHARQVNLDDLVLEEKEADAAASTS